MSNEKEQQRPSRVLPPRDTFDIKTAPTKTLTTICSQDSSTTGNARRIVAVQNRAALCWRATPLGECRVPFPRAVVLRPTGRQAAQGCNVFNLWIDLVTRLSGGSDAAWRSMW
jgi:hypothetical protein